MKSAANQAFAANNKRAGITESTKSVRLEDGLYFWERFSPQNKKLMFFINFAFLFINTIIFATKKLAAKHFLEGAIVTTSECDALLLLP